MREFVSDVMVCGISSHQKGHQYFLNDSPMRWMTMALTTDPSKRLSMTLGKL
jgi:hypothetical protein